MSPASRERLVASFRKQRRNSDATAGGGSGGNALQSGSPFKTLASISVTVSPSNAFFPVSSSYRTQPNAQMSLRLSTGLPRACSGDMYAAVPRIIPGIVGDAPARAGEGATVGELESSSVSDEDSAANAFARPKSSILTLPSEVR